MDKDHTLLADVLADQTRKRWAQDATIPSEEVLQHMGNAAHKGFTWCIVPLDSLKAEHLHWLGLQGMALQRLSPIAGRDDKPGGWRITWLRMPHYIPGEE